MFLLEPVPLAVAVPWDAPEGTLQVKVPPSASVAWRVRLKGVGLASSSMTTDVDTPSVITGRRLMVWEVQSVERATLCMAGRPTPLSVHVTLTRRYLCTSEFNRTYKEEVADTMSTAFVPEASSERTHWYA